MKDDGEIDQTEETLAYCAAPDGQRGTVEITVSTTDDEGIHEHDVERVEVEIPSEGALSIDVDSDEVDLAPNGFDGNPRVDR